MTERLFLVAACVFQTLLILFKKVEKEFIYLVCVSVRPPVLNTVCVTRDAYTVQIQNYLVLLKIIEYFV